MKTPIRISFLTLLHAAVLMAATTRGQDTAFTYQGSLTDSGLPATGVYHFRFVLHDNPDGGNAVTPAFEAQGIPVRNGLFAVTLDFGADVFTGAPRWLQIEVRSTNKLANYTALLPRQFIASTPHAIAARTITGPLPAAAITGTFSNAVMFVHPGNRFTGAFIGDGAGLTGIAATCISSGVLSLARGGTGADTATGARFNLEAASRGANSDITSLSGLTTPLSIEQGGTGGRTASNALATLGAASLLESNQFVGVNLMLNASNSFVGTFRGLGSGLTGLDAGGVASGVLPAVRGGTGADNPAGARLNLGAAARGANSDITSLSGLSTPLSLEQGGTGAGNPAEALIRLGGVSLSGSNTFTGVNVMVAPSNRFAGSFAGNGAQLTALDAGNLASGVVPVIRGGTGAGTTNGARTALGAAASGANSDITSLSGLVTPLTLAQGGTGAATGAGARTALGAAARGTNSDIVALTALSTPLSMAQGGTGADTATGARSALGAAARGTNTDITALAGLAIPLSIAQGGTGASNPSNALANLGGVSLAASNTFDGVNSLLHPLNRFAGTFSGNGSGLTSLNAASLTTGVLPGSLLSGTYGNALQMNNPANVMAGTFNGDGAGLVNLDASKLSAGIVPDQRLSTNVLLQSGSPSFAGSVTAGGDLRAQRLNVGTGHLLAGNAATIGGGASNQAGGQAATVPGGENNEANGDFSLAAGRGAKAHHPGTLVWADASEGHFGSSAPNQFLVRAGGGMGINTTNPTGKALLVNGPIGVQTNHTLEFGTDVPGKQALAGRIGYEALTPGALDIVGAGTNLTSRRIKFWAEGGALFHGTGTNSLLTVANTVDEPASISFSAPFSTWEVGQNKPPDAPTAFDSFFIHQKSAHATRLLITDSGRVGLGTNNPGHPLHLVNGAHCTAAGVWNSVSDRNAKTDFSPIDPREVLSRVASMPVSHWRYKVEGAAVKHLGPTAQDFHSAFGLGESDRTIGTVDADGVALAAIQGLNLALREKEGEIRALQSQNRDLERRLRRLEAAMRRVQEGGTLPP